MKRFKSVCRPKEIAINLLKPLILLPQTYGPYCDKGACDQASQVVRKASMAWARDLNSYEILKQLLGDQFDPEIHLQAVDVAFGLEPDVDGMNLPTNIKELFSNRSQSRPIVGINVSGLIYNNPDKAKSSYGLRVDYKELIINVLRRFLDKTDCLLILVPHVVDEIGHYESDVAACHDLVSRLDEQGRNRIVVAPANLTAAQAKGLIAKMDWFCGTRMHATIAALSSGVPTATIVYSDKAKGVFATCNQEQYVFDPRILEQDQIIEGVLSAYNQRDAVRAELEGEISQLLARAQEPFIRVSELLRAGKC
jgi:colanic acid/amylovoran biosynthesis protein